MAKAIIWPTVPFISFPLDTRLWTHRLVWQPTVSADPDIRRYKWVPAALQTRRLCRHKENRKKRRKTVKIKCGVCGTQKVGLDKCRVQKNSIKVYARCIKPPDGSRSAIFCFSIFLFEVHLRAYQPVEQASIRSLSEVWFYCQHTKIT